MPDGTYTICEKVCIDGLKIGHISTGINYDFITKIITGFNEILTHKCKSCDISSLCTVCYAYLVNEKKLGIKNEECINKHVYLNKLIEIIEKI